MGCGERRQQLMPFVIESKEAGELCTSSAAMEADWEWTGSTEREKTSPAKEMKRRKGKGRVCLMLDHRSQFRGHCRYSRLFVPWTPS